MEKARIASGVKIDKKNLKRASYMLVAIIIALLNIKSESILSFAATDFGALTVQGTSATRTGSGSYTFTPRVKGKYLIEVWGGAGGGSLGGKGGYVKGEITLAQNESLEISMGFGGGSGHSAMRNWSATGGGGGACSVSKGGEYLLIAAGGGGGSASMKGGQGGALYYLRSSSSTVLYGDSSSANGQGFSQYYWDEYYKNNVLCSATGGTGGGASGTSGGSPPSLNYDVLNGPGAGGGGGYKGGTAGSTGNGIYYWQASSNTYYPTGVSGGGGGGGASFIYTRYMANYSNSGGASSSSQIKITLSQIIMPDAPTIKLSYTDKIDGAITATAIYPSGALEPQIKLKSTGVWQSYTAPVAITENMDVYARYKDAEGILSHEAVCNVRNIDRMPVIEAEEIGDGDNFKVTITYRVPNSAKKEYKVNAGLWQVYTAPVTVNKADKIYARETDTVGAITTENMLDLFRYLIGKVSGGSTPVINVPQNTMFSAIISQYDKEMVNNEKAIGGKVQAINTSTTDGYVEIAGKIETVGVYIAEFGAGKVIIRVLEEPTASNVKVTFD